MQQFLQQLFNGIALGSIYALIALGYTMVYGIIKLINFAHGDIYMLGAYIGFTLATSLQLEFFPTLIITMLLTGLVGVIIEKVAYKPLRKATRITALITAIGVSYFLQAVVQLSQSATPKAFPELIHAQVYNIFNITVNTKQIIIIATAIVLTVILEFIVFRTKIGSAMRAVAQDENAAKLMGIDINLTISITFLIGSMLAGAGGVLVGAYYNTINPFMGLGPGLKAFIAAVFGGIGLIKGAIVGGLLIGIIEAMVSGYLGSLYKDGVVYVILILILILKPSGILGKNEKEKV